MIPEAPAMRKLFERVTRNADIKLAAALLALVTWYYLATAGVEPRRFLGVPVRIINQPDDVALLSLKPPEVTVELKGPRGRLDVLEGRGLVVELDLKDVQVEPGQPLNRNIPVSGSLVRVEATGERTAPLLAEVSFLTAEPAAVALTLNRMTERELPVRVEFDGEPAQGFVVQQQYVIGHAIRIGLSPLKEIVQRPVVSGSGRSEQPIGFHDNKYTV